MNRRAEEASSSTEGTTLVEVLAAYADGGFDGSFMVTDDAQLECLACHSAHAPENVALSSLRRMEGESDPADMLAVVALTCPQCGARGTTVLGFGPAASAQDAAALAALRNERHGEETPAHSAPGEVEGDSGPASGAGNNDEQDTGGPAVRHR